jgi:hypothetical protein
LAAADEAAAIGFGGVTRVAQASGLSRGTVIRGMTELKTAPKPHAANEFGEKAGGSGRWTMTRP